jgi:3',5'-cyclic AMP phosphodiesterase CpdA
MTRLLHLSDLHFGKDRPDLLAPLLNRINDLKADLVTISGDLTQRAREREYEAAYNFIDQIDAPVLSIPGNHDIPVHRPVTRFLQPWRYYRRWISSDLTPVFENDEMIVVGLNTVDRFRWQTGRLSRSRIAKACAAIGDVPATKLRVLVAHHPLTHPSKTKKKPIPGAAAALNRLLDCGADMILSGHLHTWHADTFASTTDRNGGSRAIQLHAGTSLSSRVRGEPNDFNLVTISPDTIEVDRISYDEENGNFETTETRHFDRVSLNSQ